MSDKKLDPEKLKTLGFQQYMKIEPTWARQMEKEFACNTLEGDNIKGKAGDFLCIGVKGEMWPVDKEVFETTYRLKDVEK